MAKAKAPPTGVVRSAATAAAELDRLGVGYALIGGLAISARAEPRYTRDVDFALSVPDDDRAEQILHALSRRNYRLATIIEQSRTGRLATARLSHIDAPRVFLDLLFASSGIEPELVENAEALAYDATTTLPVAQVGHLIALKVLSESDRRLQDRIDLQHLARIATPDDWSTALQAVRLIRERQCHRGRALQTRLRRWRSAG
jgi:hypothetical protein